jgi:hypothetical protein
MVQKFWWGSREGERKPNWVSWKDMCKPKHLGGLGFRDIELFNLALLARQGWRLLQNPDSLSARVPRARYYPNRDLLNASVGSSPSQVWRAIHEGLQVLKQGLMRRTCTGEDTNPWNDQWLPRDGMLRPIACVASDALRRELPGRVSDFMAPSTASWNETKLRQFFLLMYVEVYLTNPTKHSTSC